MAHFEIGILAIVLLALACGGQQHEADRFELFAIAPAAVRTFEYETPQFHCAAQRFAAGEPLHTTLTTRRDVLHRESPEALLAPFTRVELGARIAQRVLPREPVYHRLRLAPAPPMPALSARLLPLDTGQLAIEIAGEAYATNLSSHAVYQLVHALESMPP